MSMQTPQTSNNSPTEQANKHTGLKVFIVIVIIALIIFGVVKLAEYLQTGKNNSSGTTKLTSRSARNSDITVELFDQTLFDISVEVIPNVDIDNLELEFEFFDNNNSVIATLTRSMNDVSKGKSYRLIFNMSDFGFSGYLHLSGYRCHVSKGTVSYFAN